MFDTARAYGLGLILQFSTEEEDEVTLKDRGSVYILISPRVDRIEKKDVNNLCSTGDLFNWKETFVTLQRSIKKELKNSVKAKIEEIKDTWTNSNLEQFEKPRCVKFFYSRSKDHKNLYQSMDLAGSKGYRVLVKEKGKYTEGSSIFVQDKEWSLAALGMSHIGIWVPGRNNITSILPVPEKVDMAQWRNIRGKLNINIINRQSIQSSVVHTAILLLLAYIERGDVFADEFSSLIHNSMKYTGSQTKPGTGGLYPLAFLYDLLERNEEDAGEIFALWNDIFSHVANGPGRENLALSLSNFIINPNRDTWDKYSKIHLRYLLKENAYIRAYKSNIVEEVIENV